MLNSDQSAVYVLHGAPAVLPPLHVGNCKIPLAVLRPLARHKMCEGAVARLDLTKNDIVKTHFVRWAHGIEVALVVGMDPRKQRPTRASVDHGLPANQLLLEHEVPGMSAMELFR